MTSGHPPMATQPWEWDCARLFGVEQEYYVSCGSERLSFERVIHGLPVAGRRIDPGDLNAYRLYSGHALTADGSEAEVATPPLLIQRSFTRGVLGAVQSGYRELRCLLPPEMGLQGASTHLSIDVPSEFCDRLAVAYSRTFAPGLMLLWGPATGCGLYIRPRPGRLEFCGDFVAGSRLAATALFVAASVRYLLHAVDDWPCGLPVLVADARPAPERLGIELLPTSFGDNLDTRGREATLRTVDGGVVNAGRHLAAAWTAVRPFATAVAERVEFDLVDRMVAGELPLGIEPTTAQAARWRLEPTDPTFAWKGTNLRGWSRPGGLSIVPRWDSWHVTVFEFRRGTERALMPVRRAAADDFCERVESGAFDDCDLSTSLILQSRADIAQERLFASITSARILTLPERPPGPVVLATTASATISTAVADPPLEESRARPGKWLERTPASTGLIESTGGCFRPSAIGLAIMLLTAIAVLVGLAAWLRAGGTGGPADDVPGEGPTPTSTAVADSTPTGTSGVVPTDTPAPSETPAGSAGAPTAPPTPTAPGDGTETPTPPAATETASPTPTTAAAPPTEEPTKEPTPAPTPAPPVITTSLLFNQVISSITGNCGEGPKIGADLSTGEPTAVTIDWEHHTIQVADSQVSAFDPVTLVATILWGTPDERSSTVTIRPDGLAGGSSFRPFWNVPGAEDCVVGLTTTASVVDGQSLVP